MKKILGASILLVSSTAFAAEAPKPTVADLFGGSTPQQANLRAAMSEVTFDLPQDTMMSLPGVAPSDADIASSMLEELVNPANANAWIPFFDLQVASPGPETAVRRIFNTRDPSKGEFGAGFSWSYGESLQKLGDSLIVHDPDGGMREFLAKGSGKWVHPQGGQTIVAKDDGWLRTAPGEGSAERYDKDGRLVEKIDAYGKKTTVKRDERGRIKSIVASNGRTLTFTTDANGRVLSVKDPAGTTMSYAYDGDGRMVSSTKAGLTTDYAYDADGQLVSVVYPLGEELHLDYNQAGWLVSAAIGQEKLTARYTADAQHSDLHGAEVTLDGETTKYEYDDANGSTRIVHSSGNVESRKVDPTCGCLGEAKLNDDPTHFVYDDQGRLLRVVNAAGSMAWEYGPRAPRRYIAKGEGKTIVVGYDDAGSVMSVETEGMPPISYDRVDGQVTGVRVAGALMRRMEYDAAGDLVSIGDANGSDRIGIQYDAAGNPIALLRNDFLKVDLETVTGKPVPKITVALKTKSGIKRSVLGPEEMAFLYGDTASAMPKKRASLDLDGIPGTKVASLSDGIMYGEAITPEQAAAAGQAVWDGVKWAWNKWSNFIAPPGPRPCTAWNLFSCEMSSYLACIIPSLTNTLIPFAPLVGFKFDTDTGEFKIEGSIWEQIRSVIKDGDAVKGVELIAEDPDLFTKDGEGKILPEAGKISKWLEAWAKRMGKMAPTNKIPRGNMTKAEWQALKKANRALWRQNWAAKAAKYAKYGKIGANVFKSAFAIIDIYYFKQESNECDEFSKRLSAAGGCP